MDGVWIPIIAVSGGMVIAAVAIVSEHFQKMAKIQASNSSSVNTNVSNVLEEIRREMAELRDTTTRYDMSFDSALQRVESRVSHIEGRLISLEHSDSNQARTT